MKFVTYNSKIILKNNFLFLKDIYYAQLKIPNDIYIYILKNSICINSKSFNIKNENSFFKILNNLIIGIKNLWSKELFFSGIGYKIFIKNKKIYFDLGFSKIKFILIPNYILIEILKEKIIVKSSYKDKIGIFINKILKNKKYDPYKKKGLFFENPIVKKSSKKKQ